MGIVNEKIDQYLELLMPIEDSFLKDLQREGLEDEIPIIQVPSLKLIEVLLYITKPKVIIEVGTAIGFSALWMAKAHPNTKIHTIERKPSMAERARQNIKKAGLEQQIIVHEGDAMDILPTLPTAQFIFIDAAKGKYVEFFELAYPLLDKAGIMIFDNILFRGYVADDEIAESKPMLRKLRKFNDFIAQNKKVETAFIPIGDGLAICYKTEETP